MQVWFQNHHLIKITYLFGNTRQLNFKNRNFPLLHPLVVCFQKYFISAYYAAQVITFSVGDQNGEMFHENNFSKCKKDPCLNQPLKLSNSPPSKVVLRLYICTIISNQFKTNNMETTNLKKSDTSHTLVKMI